MAQTREHAIVFAYNGCDGLNRAVFDLAPEAELITWDITALGLPAADMPSTQGALRQHLETPGVWLERGSLSSSCCGCSHP